MKDEIMFSELLNLEHLSKEQVKKAKSLSKKFSPTSKADLEKANELLFSLLCSRQRQGVDICLEILTKLKFNGNFNLWTFIQPSYCIKYFLTDNEKTKETITNMLLKDVKSKWHNEDEHQDFIKNILDGELVQSSKEQLDRYINDGIKTEYAWRVSLLSEYLYVLALGATGSLNKTIVVTEITNNLARLEEIYKLLKY